MLTYTLVLVKFRIMRIHQIWRKLRERGATGGTKKSATGGTSELKKMMGGGVKGKKIFLLLFDAIINFDPLALRSFLQN